MHVGMSRQIMSTTLTTCLPCTSERTMETKPKSGISTHFSSIRRQRSLRSPDSRRTVSHHNAGRFELHSNHDTRDPDAPLLYISQQDPDMHPEHQITTTLDQKYGSLQYSNYASDHCLTEIINHIIDPHQYCK